MLRDFRIARAIAFGLASLALFALAACSGYEGVLPKQMRPLEESTRKLVERKGMEQTAPILVRLFKEEAVLEVWKQEKDSGGYAFLKEYAICTWSGVLGPKIKEGDRQAPEGFYTVRPAQMNPNSTLYLSFDMGFPNAFDRAWGRTGSNLMVHGSCSSRGCYSMTDENIQEIYTLGRLAFQGGQREFQVQAYPFRMTPENLARYRNDPYMPFWLMLKDGNDHFELTGQPPKIDVCDRRYVFDATAANGRGFNPTASCPPMSMPEPLRLALLAKDAKDRAQMLALAERLDRREATQGAASMRLAFANPEAFEHTALAPMSVAVGGLSLEASPSESVPRAVPPVAVPAAADTPAAGHSAASVSATPRAPALPPETAPEPELAVDPAVLPVLELAAPAQAAGANPSNAATLEERMLVGSAPADARVEDSYATATEEDEALSGMLLRLKKKKP